MLTKKHYEGMTRILGEMFLHERGRYFAGGYDMARELIAEFGSDSFDLARFDAAVQREAGTEETVYEMRLEAKSEGVAAGEE